MSFTGRRADLSHLEALRQEVVKARGATRGRAALVMGRRRVGKSRLVQELCDRTAAPYVIFQATRGRGGAAERSDFLETVAQSGLANAELLGGLAAHDWNQALRALAAALPSTAPTVVVLDEVPWLIEQDKEFEGALQTVWDQHLSRKPVLLLLVGSDLSVMESLQTYGRPFFGRAAKMVIEPLHVADVAAMTKLGAVDAIDAWLLTGGFPEIVASWPRGATYEEFLRDSLSNPLSPLLRSGELALLGEFPQGGLARAVLEAIGSGERTFSTIATAAAVSEQALRSGTLTPLLEMLQTKRVIRAELPLSTKADTKNKRYYVVDPYLRFWLGVLARLIPSVERGRADVALARARTSWTAWRGRAIEPFVRESLRRMLPNEAWPHTEAIGGWWNRQNNPEIDLVGADREPVAKTLSFVGSIKWTQDVFGREEYHALARAASVIPGASDRTPLVAVACKGFAKNLPLAAKWSAVDLVAAWR